ncbi:MAG: MTH938/NDUFAF3 family protein [Bacillota bacterium]
MRIDGYRFGEIVIGGKKYTSDVVVLADRVALWWRQKGHTVVPADLQEILAAHPEFLVIGTGAHGAVRVLPEVKDFLAAREIKLVTLPTGEACKRYNELREKHRVAAALHLTC